MNIKTSNLNKRGDIKWNTTIFMILFHAAAVASLFMFSWKVLPITLLLWWISGSLGIGMGFHRLLTHRGYKTPKAIEYFLTFCGLLALEGGAINWVVTHRIHHANTDVAGDPHTPRDGRWWAHMGWILRGTAQQHEESVMQRDSVTGDVKSTVIAKDVALTTTLPPSCRTSGQLGGSGRKSAKRRSNRCSLAASCVYTSWLPGRIVTRSRPPSRRTRSACARRNSPSSDRLVKSPVTTTCS